MIVFVSGGARSGKSQIAEQQAVSAAGSSPCYYLATADVYDDEMAERVARHRHSRQDQWQNVEWKTIEAPLRIDQAIAKVPDGGAVLLDCLTLWASQVLYTSKLSEELCKELCEGLCEEEGLALLANALADARARSVYLVIVSNDINEALPPTDAETWRYLAFLQRAHCWLAAEADSVLEVVAGSVLTWKDEQCKYGKELSV